jgi:hypothetical protein
MLWVFGQSLPPFSFTSGLQLLGGQSGSAASEPAAPPRMPREIETAEQMRAYFPTRRSSMIRPRPRLPWHRRSYAGYHLTEVDAARPVTRVNGYFYPFGCGGRSGCSWAVTNQCSSPPYSLFGAGWTKRDCPSCCAATRRESIRNRSGLNQAGRPVTGTSLGEDGSIAGPCLSYAPAVIHYTRGKDLVH